MKFHGCKQFLNIISNKNYIDVVVYNEFQIKMISKYMEFDYFVFSLFRDYDNKQYTVYLVIYPEKRRIFIFKPV